MLKSARPLILLALLAPTSASAGPETGLWARDAAACAAHYTADRPDLLELGPGGFSRWRETCRFSGARTRAGAWTVETATCRIYEGGDYQVRLSWRLLSDRFLATALGSGEVTAWLRCSEEDGWRVGRTRSERASPAAAHGFAVGYAAEAAKLCPNLDEDGFGAKALLAEAISLEKPGEAGADDAVERGSATFRERHAVAGVSAAAFCAGLLKAYGREGSITPGLLEERR